ncbi:MAG: MEKHLA domain-containing protein [Acaryochloris sp. RU_4_1]|nr:MEKHLA domain-containing protein [Acaryochloris sp. RU_4_1]NJR53909.1 MEKHLA domain-containing protein [Acaryochloris sp. CRU_2_0]
MDLAFLPWQQADIIRHSLRLRDSFECWTGEILGQSAQATPDAIAHDLFYAPFALLSHGMEADPILNYGNQQTLDLWEITWDDLTQMPSRLTAEPTEQQERTQLLNQAAQQGYIRNYQGVRISKTGRRFRIENAEIWDVLDEKGQKCGQAARFSQWQWL